jgi:hypothetical protein
MTPRDFDEKITASKLEQIHNLLMNGAGDDAIEKIRSVVTELRSDADGTTPQRLILAHLKAAEVQIEGTHLAPAADSVGKAIYVATHESQVEIEAPDPQLNV